jgi:hypothetical protein
MTRKNGPRTVEDREHAPGAPQEASEGGVEHFCDDHSYVGSTPCPNCEGSAPELELVLPKHRTWHLNGRDRNGRSSWRTELEASPVVYTLHVWQESHPDSGKWLVMLEGSYFADQFEVDPSAPMTAVFAKAKSLVRLHLLSILEKLA